MYAEYLLDPQEHYAMYNNKHVLSPILKHPLGNWKYLSTLERCVVHETI